MIVGLSCHICISLVQFGTFEWDGPICKQIHLQGMMMTNRDWVKEFPVAITVVDTEGVILEMNDKSAETFKADGGRALIGTNSLECHPEPSRTRLRQLLKSPQPNLYTIERGGKKKLICQMPWRQAGNFSGIVELSIELPAELPHFVRD